MGVAHFEKINWLPVSEIATTAFKYRTRIVSSYINVSAFTQQTQY